MLNFDDVDLVKNRVYNKDFVNNKQLDNQTIKFFNERYHKENLSDYIVVNKQPRKETVEPPPKIKSVSDYLKK